MMALRLISSNALKDTEVCRVKDLEKEGKKSFSLIQNGGRTKTEAELLAYIPRSGEQDAINVKGGLPSVYLVTIHKEREALRSSRWKFQISALQANRLISRARFRYGSSLPGKRAGENHYPWQDIRASNPCEFTMPARWDPVSLLLLSECILLRMMGEVMPSQELLLKEVPVCFISPTPVCAFSPLRWRHWMNIPFSVRHCLRSNRTLTFSTHPSNSKTR